MGERCRDTGLCYLLLYFWCHMGSQDFFWEGWLVVVRVSFTGTCFGGTGEFVVGVCCMNGLQTYRENE